MLPKRELTVTAEQPIPAGYTFLPKGSHYKTLHCRRLTHEAGKALYIVTEHNKAIGIRIPKAVFFTVQALARVTLHSRLAITSQREASSIQKAATELERQFPRISNPTKGQILRHAFRKHSGRVGRTTLIPLPRKVFLAVIAHARHVHTDYDSMLGKGVQRGDARRAVAPRMQNLLREWGSTEDHIPYLQSSTSNSTCDEIDSVDRNNDY